MSNNSGRFVWMVALLCQAVQAREVGFVEDLKVGDTLQFPIGYEMNQVNRDRKTAMKKIADPLSQSVCAIATTNTEVPMVLNNLTTWSVVKKTETRATIEDCRSEARRKLKESFQGAQKTVEDSWVTDSPVQQSLLKKKFSEQYLKRNDQINVSKTPCSEFLNSSEEKKLKGPEMITMENAHLRTRQLQLWCDRRNVKLDVLASEEIALNPEKTPATNSYSGDSRRLPASEKASSR